MVNSNLGSLNQLNKQFQEVTNLIEGWFGRGDPTCEWMYGDENAAARLNPLRWSGAISIEVCVNQLEAAMAKNKNDRPIIVKKPAGAFAKEHLLESTNQAIVFIKSRAQSPGEVDKPHTHEPP